MTNWRQQVAELWIRLFGQGNPKPERISEFTPPSAEIDLRTLEQGLYQVEMLKRSGFDLSGKTVLDIGTGWQPTIPLILFLAGCDDTILIDQERVLDHQLLVRTAANLRGHAKSIAKRLGLGERDVVQRLRVSADTTHFGVLRQFHMQYLAPYDLLKTTFADKSIDVITSRAPLAHFSARYVDALLPAMSKLLRPDGLLCMHFDQKDRLEYLNLLNESSCRLMIEESDTELRVVSDGEAPAEDPTRSLAFLVASCISAEGGGVGE